MATRLIPETRNHLLTVAFHLKKSSCTILIVLALWLQRLYILDLKPITPNFLNTDPNSAIIYRNL